MIAQATPETAPAFCPPQCLGEHRERARHLLSHAVALWAAGCELSAGIVARAALEAHLSGMCLEDPRVKNLGRPCSVNRAKVVLYSAGVIDRYTSNQLKLLSDIGSKAAHGHQVSYEKLAHMLHCVQVILRWWPSATTVDDLAQEGGGV